MLAKGHLWEGLTSDPLACCRLLLVFCAELICQLWCLFGKEKVLDLEQGGWEELMPGLVWGSLCGIACVET